MKGPKKCDLRPSCDGGSSAKLDFSDSEWKQPAEGGEV